MKEGVLDEAAHDTPRVTVALDFTELYRDNRDGLWAYLVGILHDEAAAEDVVQLAFERAWRRRRLFSLRRGGPRAWLYAIARNAALDELRRRKRQAVPLAEVPEQVPEEALRNDVPEVVKALPLKDRELIYLRFWADLPQAEIARVLGTSETNVSTRLHRTLTKLKEVIDDD